MKPTRAGAALPSSRWVPRLRAFFAAEVIARGTGYVPAVTVSGGDAERMVAKVRGTEVYTVALAKRRTTIDGWCSCPYSAGQFAPCKHLWAALLIAEQRGQFSNGPAPTRFNLNPGLEDIDDPAAIDLDDLEDLDDIEDFDDLAAELAEYDGLGVSDPPEPTSRLARALGTHPSLRLAEAHADPRPVPSWRQVLAASAAGASAERRLRQDHTSLRYVVVPSELRRARTTIYPVEAKPCPDGKAHLHCSPARERVRALGRDAHPVEHWLATSNPHYGLGASEPPFPIFDQVLHELARTGRLHSGERVDRLDFEATLEPLGADDGEPWKLELELVGPHAGAFHLVGWLARGSERRPLAEPEVLTVTGLALWKDRVARFDPRGAFTFVSALRGEGPPLSIPSAEVEEFVREYHLASTPPPLRLPGGRELERVSLAPTPVLELTKPERGATAVTARVWFEYDDWRAAILAPGEHVLDWGGERLIRRELEAERTHAAELKELGFKGPALRKNVSSADGGAPVTLPARHLPHTVRSLVARGWQVEADGKPYALTGRPRVSIKSGIDWFELDVSIEFSGAVAELPALLRALRNGQHTVVLDDGSVGLLPEEWLARFHVLGELTHAGDDKVRFTRSEAPLLAALVAESTDGATFDETFERLLGELTRGTPKPLAPPAKFQGTLRRYQQEGLGWLTWLEGASVGGCLADDMGLGKTVQVLALLAKKRPRKLPSLVVAPRSVLFNWASEAARFAPTLTVRTHWGPEREPAERGFAGADLVLTTYGTLRAEAAAFAAQRFEFIVLDEAQAIKNAQSHTARAVRTLSTEHRLALTGTPIENHLGELVSLFDFLNPGLLRRARRLKGALSASSALDGASAALLARAVRPFILRRTKAEVATDLPERIEQTLHVELKDDEQRAYDELHAHYRSSLLRKGAPLGARSAPHVLAALLRLRQAACHPGLLDPKRTDEPSAKLDVLLAQLEQVVDGGHKALVFSQFTSLLAIVRARLEERRIEHAYLDGKTRDRQAVVDRFQTDRACPVFLISLKAGGVGLNLTAADYVFILDPWWNPAVEAQAIDRAHRIGQTKRVVAYRLLARGTVEEKVEELKTKKRALVQAVLGDEAGFTGKLTQEDLELLLG